MRTRTRNDRLTSRRGASRASGIDGIAVPGFFRRAVARLLGRPKATTFHRTLALHLVLTAPGSALD